MYKSIYKLSVHALFIILIVWGKRILRKISFDTEMRNGFFSMIISDQTKKTERESKKKKEKNSFSRRRNYIRERIGS